MNLTSIIAGDCSIQMEMLLLLKHLVEHGWILFQWYIANLCFKIRDLEQTTKQFILVVASNHNEIY